MEKGLDAGMKQTNKIFLITINWGETVTKKGSKYNPTWLPLELLNSASLLKQKKFSPTIVDLRFEKLPLILKKDFVFITSCQLDKWLCPNTDLNPFFDAIKTLPKEKLFVLGAHGTFFPEKILLETGAKAVIRGEPEETIAEVCSKKPFETINKNITISQVKAAVNMAKQVGMETLCFFMIGFPNETKEDVDATINCAKSINPTYVTFNILTPYPTVFPNENGFFPNCLKEHDYLELEKEKKRAFMAFYLRPSYVISRLFKPFLWRKQANLFLSFIRR